MCKRGYVVIGAALIALGLLALISSWIGVDFCALVLPLLVMSAGVYILVRPRYAARGGAIYIQPLGGIKRTGAWTAVDEELWILIGDASFDLSQVTLPPSETVIRILGFVGDVKLVVPDTVPVAITSVAFLTSSRIFGAKRDTFLQSRM